MFSAKPRYVRVNINKMSRSEAMESFVNDGWIEVTCENYDEFLNAIENLTDEQFIADLHVKDLFIFPASSKRYWALSSLAKESKVILQDKASCLPSFLLNPPRKSYVLDMCAAPGMKTSHLAAIMKNKGTIWAVERDRKRFELLTDFAQKTSSQIVKTINDDILAIGSLELAFRPHFNQKIIFEHISDPSEYKKVEYILLDPPCSGSGMTNRFNIFGENSDDRLLQLQSLQSKMLIFALKNFPNAKKLIYSTCSINVEENEQVIFYHEQQSYLQIYST